MMTSGRALLDELIRYVGKTPETARPADWTRSLAKAVRDTLAAAWLETERRHDQADVKRAYYLSAEFLPGRQLANAMLARGNYDEWASACDALGLDIDTLADAEHAPALGNGGLGRLAACLMDSLATHDLPGYAYGIRYHYGMFRQQIRDGYQTEAPENWLADGHPWEFKRPELTYTVGFGGRVRARRWMPAERVQAIAHDVPVPGYNTDTVLTLRLWSAEPVEPFDLAAFNRGEHRAAVAERNRCEDICRVLYPDDRTPAGQELRLRQEFFFSSAALQDILARHRAGYADADSTWRALPDRMAIHLNDTHPAIAIAELMRLLVDEHALAWDRAWRLCQSVFSYTNHTLMPEALENWPVELMGALLPRHLEIIYEINAHFLAEIRDRFPDDYGRVRRLSLIDEEQPRSVRMAHLAVLVSHRVNGVSALHGRLMVDHVFADFAALYPNRFTHVTNGITPRRWLNQANPGLARLLDARIGTAWQRDLTQIARVAEHAHDPAFRDHFACVKQENKQRLAAHIEHRLGLIVDPASLFDVQIKRVHEYKRQLLNVLGVITRYARILADPNADIVARTVIFSGKAASSYEQAKRIIKLVHDVAKVINTDERVAGRLKVVFIPDYGVREAELIVPAADLSEQISTAGTEASGTGNMKLALNGALTLGTEDGANIEIRDAVGADNVTIFGHDAAAIRALRAENNDPQAVIDADAELAHALYMIGAGAFSRDEPGRHRPLLDAVIDGGDYFKVASDYRAYVEAQDAVDARYRDRETWLDASIANVAGMGGFSSDAMARRYAHDIWGLTPVSIHETASTGASP